MTSFWSTGDRGPKRYSVDGCQRKRVDSLPSLKQYVATGF